MEIGDKHQLQCVGAWFAAAAAAATTCSEMFEMLEATRDPGPLLSGQLGNLTSSLATQDPVLLRQLEDTHWRKIKQMKPVH